MRVIHVITRLILGGAQENTLFNCEDLIREFGDDVLLVTGPAEGPEGDLFTRARSNGVPVDLLPELRRAVSPSRDLAALRKLNEIIRRFRPDVVHTHSSKAGILGRAAAYRCKVPAIIHTVHGLPFHPYERWWRNAVYVQAERWAARRCHRIISVADAMTQQALAAGIGRPEQYVTIYSGMEVEPFLSPTRPRDLVRSELGIDEQDVAIMKVARLFEFKGHDDVIDASQEVLATVPKARFVFVGGGAWRDRLEERVRSTGLASRFVFTGLVPPERIPELLSASDIVVHASYREGLARVLPQALITGRPVISYDVDGAREVVRPNQTGCLVAPGDSKGLAAAMIELAKDPAKRQRFGCEGQRLFTDQFRHEKMTQQIRTIYSDVLDQRGQAS